MALEKKIEKQFNKEEIEKDIEKIIDNEKNYMYRHFGNLYVFVYSMPVAIDLQLYLFRNKIKHSGKKSWLSNKYKFKIKL